MRRAPDGHAGSLTRKGVERRVSTAPRFCPVIFGWRRLRWPRLGWPRLGWRRLGWRRLVPRLAALPMNLAGAVQWPPDGHPSGIGVQHHQLASRRVASQPHVVLDRLAAGHLDAIERGEPEVRAAVGP